MTCSLFGHRYISNSIETKLREELINLITNNGCNLFYVGNNGEFDRVALRILKELSDNYSIIYYVVLAYMNSGKGYEDISIYPEGLEFVNKRFAITSRNRWMVDNSDYVLCYVQYSGGAEQALKRARAKGKIIINIA
ncbi:MAG: hypothetical protein E7652_02105 [Ruminococcaceae bacterium]|nr:hypothetical protein [Oscillospiraceae bacterium]